jgi:hypothetical protein
MNRNRTLKASVLTASGLTATGLMVAALSSAALLPPARAPAAATARDAAQTSLHDFDFLMGEWRVHHRRLKERLAGSHEWVEFDGTTSATQILGGSGNMDDNFLDMPGGAYRAVSLRAFDPKTGQWAIWWLDGRNPDSLDTPVKGRFENGVGTFYADDTFKERPIKIRFVWSQITATTCRWEQAFSPDSGRTWETNWVMEFRRKPRSAPGNARSGSANLLI